MTVQERIVPGAVTKTLFNEHRDRYIWASQYVRGKDVLDIACGNGIGTNYLRESADRVIGIDIDEEAIEFAKAHYPRCNFHVGRVDAIPLPSESVDVIVSFETIEHVAEQTQFLYECQRVLRPNGLLICSTPNLPVYRWLEKNRFHVRELDPTEFFGLIASGFQIVERLGQCEVFYPLFVTRKLAVSLLRNLRLKDFILSIIRQKVITDFDFTHDGSSSVKKLSQTFLRRPIYLICVATQIVSAKSTPMG